MQEQLAKDTADERNQFKTDLAALRGNIPGPLQNLGAALTAGGAAALAGDRTSWGGEGIGAFNEALRGGQAMSQQGRSAVAGLGIQEQRATADQMAASQRREIPLQTYLDIYHGGWMPEDAAGRADVFRKWNSFNSSITGRGVPGLFGEDSPLSPGSGSLDSSGGWLGG